MCNAKLEVRVRRLGPRDDRTEFRSGNIDLDRFFLRYAGQNQFRHHIGTTYVAVQGDRIVGFVTVSSGEMVAENLVKSLRRRLPAYPLPILRLARLAVDEQERLTGKIAEHKDIEQQLENLRELKEQDRLYKTRKQELEELIEQSVSEQEALKRDIILTFEGLSNQLYESAGSLSIQPGEKGLDYEIAIQGKGSGGVDKMQVFCFDMALAIITAKGDRNPGFLIHDSRLFDESDERQIASALAVAKDASEAHGFQYIAAFNSDRLPHDVLQAYAGQLVSPVLDDTEKGGLFGHQF